jgi:hypothetical protein
VSARRRRRQYDDDGNDTTFIKERKALAYVRRRQLEPDDGPMNDVDMMRNDNDMGRQNIKQKKYKIV